MAATGDRGSVCQVGSSQACPCGMRCIKLCRSLLAWRTAYAIAVTGPLSQPLMQNLCRAGILPCLFCCASYFCRYEPEQPCQSSPGDSTKGWPCIPGTETVAGSGGVRLPPWIRDVVEQGMLSGKPDQALEPQLPATGASKDPLAATVAQPVIPETLAPQTSKDTTVLDDSGMLAENNSGGGSSSSLLSRVRGTAGRLLGALLSSSSIPLSSSGSSLLGSGSSSSKSESSDAQAQRRALLSIRNGFSRFSKQLNPTEEEDSNMTATTNAVTQLLQASTRSKAYSQSGVLPVIGAGMWALPKRHTELQTEQNLGSQQQPQQQQQQQLGTRAVSSIFWAFAALGYTPEPSVLDSIWQGCIQGLANASPQTLSNMVWAAASLSVAPSRAWMAEWTAAASASLASWNAADVAMTAWALGRFAAAQHTRSVGGAVWKGARVMYSGLLLARNMGPQDAVWAGLPSQPELM